MKRSFLKIISLLLIVGMNWSAISLLGETEACFNDVELSEKNIMETGILNFELSSEDDFAPEVTLGQKAIREIDVENLDSTTDFKYGVRVEENPVGDLCGYLYLDDGTSNEPLNSFDSEKVLFSEKQEWIFKASLDGNGEFWQNKECKFNLVFEGQQDDDGGFSDIEIIENTVTAGEFGDHLLISKVYYDVCNETDGSCGEYKGKEPKHEWIELYNPTNQIISLKDWKICNSDRCRTINSNNDSVKISPLGYAILAHDATILKYWDILNAEVETTVIYQLGGNFEMNNDNDMLVLKDPSGEIIDQMNWGTPNGNWNNYNDDLWSPGADDVEKGHMLGRVPVGLDTNTKDDWQDFGLPAVSSVVVGPLQAEHYGCCGNGNENVSQNNCPTTWYNALGLYYSQQLTIDWTATTTNTSGDSELSIDIVYITDNDCSGDISDGDSSYTITSGTDNNGSYVWAGWINYWGDNGDDSLWKDEDGDFVPYFYGLTWIKITATSSDPENSMVSDSDTSIAMFEPMPPGISAEQMQSILENSSSCDGCCSKSSDNYFEANNPVDGSEEDAGENEDVVGDDDTTIEDTADDTTEDTEGSTALRDNGANEEDEDDMENGDDEEAKPENEDEEDDDEDTEGSTALRDNGANEEDEDDMENGDDEEAKPENEDEEGDDEDTEGSTALRDNGANEVKEEDEDVLTHPNPSQEGNQDDGASDEDGDGASSDTDAKDEKNVLDSEEKNLPDDDDDAENDDDTDANGSTALRDNGANEEDDDDVDNEDDEEAKPENEDEEGDDKDTEGSTALRDNGANEVKEEDEDVLTHPNPSQEGNQDDGANDTDSDGSNNMVDSVQASV
ncbi:MAG: lamin tail domain-containing protein [Patescibacteria group bacterium]|nr:lamin tail domain-containing protein [Patescibacteria group bacterium]